MKKRTYTFALIVILACLVSAASAQVDLSDRTTLYFTGTEFPTSLIGIPTYVEQNHSMAVKTSDGTNVGGGLYRFNFGVISNRQGGNLKAPLTATLEYTGGSNPTDIDLKFAAGQQVVQQVVPLLLKVGASKITVTIDPQNKIAESNKNNNTFSVVIVVVDPSKPKPPPIRPPKRVDLIPGVLYFLSDQKTHKSIDIDNDYNIKPNSSIKWTQEQASACGVYNGETTCNFWVGLTAFKELYPEIRAQTEFAMFDNGKKRYGFGMDFTPGVTKLSSIFKLNLTPGDHDIEIVIDPSNTIKEDNENNNSLKFHVLIPKKKGQ